MVFRARRGFRHGVARPALLDRTRSTAALIRFRFKATHFAGGRLSGSGGHAAARRTRRIRPTAAGRGADDNSPRHLHGLRRSVEFAVVPTQGERLRIVLEMERDLRALEFDFVGVPARHQIRAIHLRNPRRKIDAPAFSFVAAGEVESGLRLLRAHQCASETDGVREKIPERVARAPHFVASGAEAALQPRFIARHAGWACGDGPSSVHQFQVLLEDRVLLILRIFPRAISTRDLVRVGLLARGKQFFQRATRFIGIGGKAIVWRAVWMLHHARRSVGRVPHVAAFDQQALAIAQVGDARMQILSRRNTARQKSRDDPDELAWMRHDYFTFSRRGIGVSRCASMNRPY